MINECGAVDRKRRVGKNFSTWRKPAQHYFVHHKSYMIALESNQKNYVCTEALGMVACEITKYSDMVLFRHNKTNI